MTSALRILSLSCQTNESHSFDGRRRTIHRLGKTDYATPLATAAAAPTPATPTPDASLIPTLVFTTTAPDGTTRRLDDSSPKILLGGGYELVCLRW
jgi:hypothetical protein